MFLYFGDVINIKLTFLTNQAPFFSYISNIWLTNYAIFVTCTKDEIICETGSINMLI